MEVVVLHSDVGQVGFQRYVLNLTEAGLHSEDHMLVLVLAVLRKAGGLMLCLPEHPLSEEVWHLETEQALKTSSDLMWCDKSQLRVWWTSPL